MKSKISIFIILTLFLFGIITNIYISTDKVLADVPDKIIRLHVVANSDSPKDQQLKRDVRDAVIKKVAYEFENLDNIEMVRNTIEQNIWKIESIAKEVIRDNNKNYSVKAELGEFDFPTKQYGDLTLPAGKYQALNIKIGEAKGQNWWCVMFPPLCFIDIAHGVVPEKTMDKLKSSLTEEEYDILTASATEEDIPIRLKFKILDVAKNLNLKIVKVSRTLKNTFGIR